MTKKIVISKQDDGCAVTYHFENGVIGGAMHDTMADALSHIHSIECGSVIDDFTRGLIAGSIASIVGVALIAVAIII